MLKIQPDHDRFRKIIKGQVKKELQKYILNDAFLGRKGSETVKIPVPRINIPHFTYGQKDIGGVGQGEGEVGDSIGSDSFTGGQAGSESGDHIM